ncbi:hypothetical protein BCO18175_07309 [Burkholderia contaminans]|uniref:hypothetical protein n=1 Tax=Burkholderia contaminans TaxID=488447 RepID=UPI00145357BC|nr:hypothetical protein [Burkholderia contaminans]VWD46854.1 hypothetical protein BCO18175_07309 [Burkholderia contaminans]
MTWEHVDFWHDHVQPIIQNHYVKWKEGTGGAPTTGVRADVDWNWHYYFWLAKWWNAVRPTARRDQRAVAWCLVVLGDDGKQLPIGMLTAVPAYASPYRGDESELGFVWYLSDAPTEHYLQRGIPRVSGVASSLLDTAIQSRLDLVKDAATFLHADPGGGKKLLEFYEDKCGMDPVQEDKRISLVRSVTAGQYFAMTHAKALTFAAKFDPLRGS